jgi:hypothetical protein
MNLFDTMESWLAGEPVWSHARILKEWPELESYRRRLFKIAASGKDYGRQCAEQWTCRNDWILRYGFAIPCAELLDELALSASVVEVGAGTGYMTRLARLRGVSIVGTDVHPPGVNVYGFEVGRYDDQQKTVAAQAAVRRHPRSTVFCSWPTLNEAWFRECLEAMRVGQRIIVVREECCAESGAWEYLSECFDTERCVTMPNFEHVADYAEACVKRRHKPRRKSDAEVLDRGDDLREQ